MDVDPLEILSLYQYDGSRSSVQSVQTADRLLDKLELSPDDEQLLQLALKEESEKNEATEREQMKKEQTQKQLQKEKAREAETKEVEKGKDSSPLLCLPASAFPSLKNKSFAKPRRILTVSVADPLGKGNKGLCAGAEQHLPMKTRCSYFVEEVNPADEENERGRSFRAKQPVVRVDSRKKTVRAEIYGALNVGVAPIQRSNTIVTSTTKSAAVSRNTSSKTANFEKKTGLYQNNSNSSSSTEFGRNSPHRSQQSLLEDSDGSVDGSGVKRNNSSTTTKVGGSKDSVTESPLRLFKIPSNNESDSDDSPQRNDTKENSTKDTPTKSKNANHHNKKKGSFHFRNLFKSQKSSKRKNSSKKDSSVKGKNAGHYRSLSDHQAANDINIPSLSPDLRNRKFSLDSRRNTDQASQLATSLVGDENRDKDKIQSAAGPANHLLPSIHRKRINIANLGESARKLYDACSDGNAEACFLYGMALRHGYGVVPDEEESFHYLFAATGLKSELHDVLEIEINPFKLENDQSIPDVPPAPSAAAVYECGISYLNGYGMVHEDEFKALKFLEKAASMGHIDAMCLCGDVLSKKSDIRNRDLARAAAWFRISEKRGAHLIGAGWIYKDKYIQMAKNY